MALTKSQATINEDTSAVYQCTLKSEVGTPIGVSQISTITLTYYNAADGTIINSRSNQDIKNTNNVTISAAGVLQWYIQPGDTIIVAGTTVPGQTEEHTALFEWTWATTYQGRHELDLYILQMNEVTLDIGTTIVSSWGGGTSNSYIGLTAANSYIRYSVIDNSAWLALSSDQKIAALIESTGQIDTRHFIGKRKYSDQLLEAPREIRASFPWNRTTVGATALSASEQRMQYDFEKATCHQALYIAQNAGKSTHAELATAGVSAMRKKVGPIEEEYKYGGGGAIAGGTQKLLCPSALQYLSDWISDRRAIRG